MYKYIYIYITVHNIIPHNADSTSWLRFDFPFNILEHRLRRAHLVCYQLEDQVAKIQNCQHDGLGFRYMGRVTSFAQQLMQIIFIHIRSSSWYESVCKIYVMYIISI